MIQAAKHINTPRLAAAVFIFIATCALFSPVRNFDFLNFDDNEYVTENKFVITGVTSENVSWAFTTNHGGHYHPLSWISHMVDCQLFGLNPSAHHTVNVLFHAANVVILFFIAHLLSQSLAISILAAALFGLHPMRIESVTWISERKDVLSVFFGLLSMLSYLHFTQKRTMVRYGTVAMFFILSLLAKPTLVTAPLLLLIVDHFMLKRRPLRAVIVEKIPLALISFSMCIIAITAQHFGGGLRQPGEISISQYFASATQGYLIYMAKFLWPEKLGIFYPFQILPPGSGAGAAIGLLAISALAFGKLNSQREFAAGWLWFLVSLLPLAGFVPIGGQAYADRWSYVPHIGLIICVCSLMSQMRSITSAYIISTAAIALIALHTSGQLPHWRNSETLFRHTLAVSPDNFMAHTNLGAALDQRGNLIAALPHFEEAYRLNPTYPEAINNLGSARARFGDTAAAIDLFKKALAIRPNYYPAQRNLSIAENELASALHLKARYNPDFAQSGVR